MCTAQAWCTAGELGLAANILVVANVSLYTPNPESCVVKTFQQPIAYVMIPHACIYRCCMHST